MIFKTFFLQLVFKKVFVSPKKFVENFKVSHNITLTICIELAVKNSCNCSIFCLVLLQVSYYDKIDWQLNFCVSQMESNQESQKTNRFIVRRLTDCAIQRKKLAAPKGKRNLRVHQPTSSRRREAKKQLTSLSLHSHY